MDAMERRTSHVARGAVEISDAPHAEPNQERSQQVAKGIVGLGAAVASPERLVGMWIRGIAEAESKPSAKAPTEDSVRQT